MLLSGLDALTTEDSVLNVLGPLTKLPLKNVKIGKVVMMMKLMILTLFLPRRVVFSPATQKLVK